MVNFETSSDLVDIGPSVGLRVQWRPPVRISHLVVWVSYVGDSVYRFCPLISLWANMKGITLKESFNYATFFCVLFKLGPAMSDYNERFILLSAFHLSGGHCTTLKLTSTLTPNFSSFCLICRKCYSFFASSFDFDFVP